MSSPSESKRNSLSETVPAGTDVEQRMIARSLADAAKRKEQYWYRVGRKMARHDIKAPRAKELIERDGSVLHWGTDYLQAMRRTVETVIESDVEDKLAAQCPLKFVRDVMRHFRTGEIQELEARLLIVRRSYHIGTPNDLPFSNAGSKGGVRDLINRFSEKPQDAQESQAKQ